MKHILHDWSAEWSIKILKQLRAAAQPNTKLVLLESIIPLACHDPANEDGVDELIPGAKIAEAPAPLLPNYGEAKMMPYIADLGVRTNPH